MKDRARPAGRSLSHHGETRSAVERAKKGHIESSPFVPNAVRRRLGNDVYLPAVSAVRVVNCNVWTIEALRRRHDDRFKPRLASVFRTIYPQYAGFARVLKYRAEISVPVRSKSTRGIRAKSGLRRSVEC